MARQKLNRFAHNVAAHNVIERGKELYTQMKGNWGNYFGNSNPIVLELACGKGEYTVGLAEKNPDKNFVGVDIKGDRIARGSKLAIEKELTNAAFLRTGIQYLSEFFEVNSIDEMWLIHPDPQPRDKEEKRRLTNPNFLKLYAIYLKVGGKLYLKTDSDELFAYSLDVVSNHPNFKLIESTHNLYHSPLLSKHEGIETYYEKMFTAKGHKISFYEAERI